MDTKGQTITIPCRDNGSVEYTEWTIPGYNPSKRRGSHLEIHCFEGSNVLNPVFSFRDGQHEYGFSHGLIWTREQVSDLVRSLNNWLDNGVFRNGE